MPNLILPKPDVETIDVPYSEMRAIAQASDVLEAWGYILTCPNCARLFGYGKDGVEGNNDQGATTLTVRCSCTVRRASRGH